MNPEMPQKPQDELESSLTALLLGELPHEQAAALHQKLAQDAELAKLYERLKQTINLVRETVARPAAQAAGQPAPLRLSDQRRQKLLQHFKTVAPKAFARPRRSARRWLVPVGIAAALVALAVGTLVPDFVTARRSSLGHSWGMWSLSMPAKSAMSVPAPEDRARFYRDLNRNGGKERPASKGEDRVAGLPAAPPALARLEPAKPAGTQPGETELRLRLANAPSRIVLPESGELADATTTAPELNGANSWAEPAPADNREGKMAWATLNGSEKPAVAPSVPATAVENAGNILLGLNGPRSDSGKLADVSSLYAREKANTQPASQEAANGFELNLGTGNPNLPPSANPSGRFPGGTFLGPPGGWESNEAPAGAAQNRPALRSPKESSLAGGGGVAIAPAPSSAQETAVDEAVLRQVVRRPSPQTAPATPHGGSYSGGGAYGGYSSISQLVPNDDEIVDTVHIDNVGDVPILRKRLPSEGKAAGTSQGKVEPAIPQVAEANKALPRRAEQVPSPQTAPALKGTPQDVPVLGDAPVMGGVFTVTPGAADDNGKADITFFTSPQSGARAGSDYADTSTAWSSRFENGTAGGTARTYPYNTTNGVASFSFDPETHRLAYIADEDTGKKMAESPIVLPNAQPETSLTLKDSSEDLTKNAVTTLEEGEAKLDQKIANAKADLERLGKEVKESSSKESDVAIRSKYVSEVVPLKHGKASDIASALNGLSSGGGGTSVVGGTVYSTPKVAPKPATSAPVPQPEVQTAGNAFSTFSLNVSDVSFKLAAASLEKGVMPEPVTVRSEEFINAFDYRDPEPPPGVPVAFAWERARYPFAQNRDLLRFSIKTAAQGRQPGRPLNIVLLLDNSGSMERADRVQIIHEALRVLAGQLQAQDTFSVVTFARTARLWVDGVSGSQAAQVAEEVSGLTPQGGTNLEDAMNLAYQTALRHYLANGINRVVLLTDGAANLGNIEPEVLKQKVEAHRKQGIALDCFGIGWEGYNDDLLEVLSRNGDGRYAFLNTPEEAAGEFAAKLAGALQVAASDVKVQVEFNPGRVTAYRQIGYAKHQLTKEQFRDNTVNAAQIGAAEAGNALYVVEVNANGSGPLCTVRARFRIPGTGDYREHAWDVPFNGGAVALEQASPAMRLAATASAFAEWLASSPYAAEVTPDRLLGYLSGVPEVCGADARPKKLEWMIRQAKSIAGR